MIQNPVLPGFSPDPSVIRVNDEYYVAVSTFEWFPGVRIYCTRDLEHYEQIPSPLRRESQLHMMGNPDSCGVWAPDLSWDGERFWLVFTDVKTRGTAEYYNTHNYVIWTDDIRGEWSEPVYLNSTGFDPSLFHDMDGKSYLVNMINGFKGIQVQEFDRETVRLKGKPVNVCPGTGRGFTEGPHIYHINGWYYLMMAEGGTSWEHCEVMCRSRQLWGGYEEDPYNPFLTSDRGSPNALQKCGHADLVQTQEGEWFLFHLCARPDSRGLCVLGRETALQKVFWNKEGWLRLSAGGRYGKTETQAPGRSGKEKNSAEEKLRRNETVSLFTEKGLDLSAATLRIPPEKILSFHARKGWLRLYGYEFPTSCFKVGLVAVKQSSWKSRMECGVEFAPQSERQGAGAVYFYDTENFYLVVRTRKETGQNVIRFLKCCSGSVEMIAEEQIIGYDGVIHFKTETDERGEQASFYYSCGKEAYKKIAEADTGILTDEHCVGFTGAHFGICCYDMDNQTNYADFEYFRISDNGIHGSLEQENKAGR